MTVHIVKLCVGVETIGELKDWQSRRLKTLKAEGKPAELCHKTLQTPKRRDEVLDGGSLYWVIKGLIAARQPIIDLRPGVRANGEACCDIVLGRKLTVVEPTPRRAFQGWRYFDVKDAPPDLEGPRARALAQMPQKMRKELSDLGLL